MEDTSTIKASRTTRETILQIIVDLCEHNLVASRIRIAEMSGLPMTIVDEHIKNLKTDGLIRALYAGCYEPVDQTLDRPVSTTTLSRGRMKLEIGDDVITNLTPREAFALAKQLAGLLVVFGLAQS